MITSEVLKMTSFRHLCQICNEVLETANSESLKSIENESRSENITGTNV